MNTRSAKAKGMKLQKWLVEKVKEIFKFNDMDIKSIPSGVQGEDIWISHHARMLLPVSFECKNQERVSVWSSYDQAKTNSGDYEPVLIIKRNHHKPLAVVDAEYFLRLHK